MNEKKLEGSPGCPLPIGNHETIQLSHGGGGRMMHDLISQVFLPAFSGSRPRAMEDCAALTLPEGRLAFSTDSYVVDPLFFPGGDIGDLAVNGTVNDLSMGGAKPLYLSLGMILEEGFAIGDLRRIVGSIRVAAEKAGVVVCAGDTKVVHKGKADKIFINTSGLGLIPEGIEVTPLRIEPGDRVLVSGFVGDHGITIISAREGLGLESSVESDTAPLSGLVADLLAAAGDSVHALRDPTRGGVASVLNEFAETAGLQIRIHEERVPVRAAVLGACELLGFDPLYVANEGKLIAVVAPDKVKEVLDAMRAHPLGRHASEIGEVLGGSPGQVSLKTIVGGWRIVDMMVGEQLPRIC